MDLKYNLSKLKDFKKVAIIPTVSLPVLNYDVLHEENQVELYQKLVNSIKIKKNKRNVSFSKSSLKKVTQSPLTLSEQGEFKIKEEDDNLNKVTMEAIKIIRKNHSKQHEGFFPQE